MPLKTNFRSVDRPQPLWLGLLVLAIQLAVLWALPAQAQVVAGDIPFRGPSNAPVTLLVASEFQCPFCSRVAPTIEAVRAAHPKEVRVGYVHFPLPFHGQAMPAAKFAWAAHKQGRFWEAHDALLAARDRLGPDLYDEIGAKLGLDRVQLVRDQDGPAAEKAIADQVAALTALGVTGTPSIFVNGALVVGAQPQDAFEEAVKAALKDAPRPGEPPRAAWERHAPGKGAKVADYLLLGVEPPPPKLAPKAEDPEDHPENLKTIWKVPVDPAVDMQRSDSPDYAVTLVTFGDLQCPYCNKLRPTVAALKQRFPGQIREVFKHLPMSFHKQAVGAHLAALAAGKQGKFWEFVDKVYEDPKDLNDGRLAEIAKAVGVDVARWQRDRSDARLAAQIEADMDAADKAGADGTPTVYINGRRILGALPQASFEAVVEQELERAKAAGWRGQSGYQQAVAQGKEVGLLADDVVQARPQGVPTQGPEKAKVEVVVYFDYQCPYCVQLATQLGMWWPKWRSTGQVQLVWAPMPLSFHAMARPAAVAAQLAWSKGQFETLHPRLVGLGMARGLSEDTIADAVAQAGLNPAEWREAMERDRYDAVLQSAETMAKFAGVQGTPTVFVNGRRVTPNAQTGYAPLDELVRKLAAGGSVP